MKAILRRWENDMRNMRHIEAYTVAAVGFVIAIVSLFGDAVGSELKWSTLFTGLGVMVYRTTLPRHRAQEPGCLCTSPPEDETVVLQVDPAVRVIVVRVAGRRSQVARPPGGFDEAALEGE